MKMSEARRKAEQHFNLPPTPCTSVVYSTRGKPVIVVLVPAKSLPLKQGYDELMALKDCRYSPAIVQSKHGPCIRLVRDMGYLEPHETGKFLAAVRKVARKAEETFETQSEISAAGGRFELLYRYGV